MGPPISETYVSDRSASASASRVVKTRL